MDRNEFAGCFQVLEDTLAKKDQLLNMLMKFTRDQEVCLKAESFSMDDFDSLMEKKEIFIARVSESDAGFESLYARMKPEMEQYKAEYESRIKAIQGSIKTILQKGAALCTLEEQNKTRLEGRLSDKKQEIKNFKRSNQTVSNYYKNMSGAPNAQSFFMDKKK